MSDIEASVESKKGRGRQAKAAPKEVVEKIEEPREARKRGRPSSNEVTEKPAAALIKDDNSDEGANGDVVKRGRGRPKKGSKFGGGRGRGRGRPPKTAKKDDDQDGDEES